MTRGNGNGTIRNLGAIAMAMAAPTGMGWDGPTDLMIPMRDGVRLHAQRYLPRSESAVPVVLIRTPYGLPDGDPGWEGRRLLEHDYAIVIQNTRGRHRSEGESAAFLSDGRGPHVDGYDTVEWIAAQPWCNGRVGTWSASAPGITQLLTATAAPPHLVCQHVGIATGELNADAIFQGGAYRRYLVDTWLEKHGYDVAAHRRIYATHPPGDPFWDPITLTKYDGPVAAPVLLWGGWYDCFSQGTLNAFVHLRKLGPPEIAARHRLIMGPWPHGITREHDAGLFPEACLLPPHIDNLEWFDHHVKGIANDAVNAAPVAYWVMGAFDEPGAPGNEWRTADTWPVESAEISLYLAAEGRVSPGMARRLGKATFVYDPSDPVPTLGGSNLHLDKGCFDQRPVEQRDDVVLFTSPPLTRPLEVTGRIRVRLWVATSAPDTDFTAKLTDVCPDGRSLLVQDGIRRLRTGPVDADRPIPIEIDLWSTSLIVNRGHRLRLAVSSSNYPRFDANPNTGDLYSDDAAPVTATNTVAWGPTAPSALLLPVVGDLPLFDSAEGDPGSGARR